MKKELKVQGMMCSGCTARVTRALTGAGATDVQVTLPDSATFEDNGLDISVFVSAVEDIGYDVQG